MGGIQKEGAYVPDPLHTRPSCTWVNMPNLIDVGQTVRAYVWRRSAGKLIAPRLSKSLKIIRTDTERTYDFLLTFRSNNGPAAPPSIRPTSDDLLNRSARRLSARVCVFTLR